MGCAAGEQEDLPPFRGGGRPVACAVAALSIAVAVAPLNARARTLSIESARAELRQGDASRAEAIARAVLDARPDHAPAWVVLGLAYFQRNRFGPALSAFDRALEKGRGLESPGDRAVVHFNRASCLFKLTRAADAEASYVTAARLDREIAPLAWINAAEAALAIGAVARALKHVAAADAFAAAVPGLAGLVAEVRAAIVERDLEPGEMNGATAETSVAPDAPALVEPPAPSVEPLGLAALGRGLLVRVEMSGGYDSNVARRGPLASLQGATSSPVSAVDGGFGTLVAELAFGGSVGSRMAWRADYGFSQLAYFDGDQDAFNVQQHGLVAAAELRITDDVRIGGALRTDVLFAGLSSFGGLLADVGGRLDGALDVGRHVTLAARTDLVRATSLSDNYDYLTGTRWDGLVGVDVRAGRFDVRARARYQVNDLGEQTFTVESLDDVGANARGLRGECVPPPPFAGNVGDNRICPSYVVPLAYHGPAALVDATLSLGDTLDVYASLSIEWRRYEQTAVLSAPAGPFPRPPLPKVDLTLDPRDDTHVRAGLGASVLLLGRFDLSLRYDLTVSTSTVDNTRDDSAHPLDYDNLNFTAHSISLGVSVDLFTGD